MAEIIDLEKYRELKEIPVPQWPDSILNLYKHYQDEMNRLYGETILPDLENA